MLLDPIAYRDLFEFAFDSTLLIHCMFADQFRSQSFTVTNINIANFILLKCTTCFAWSPLCEENGGAQYTFSRVYLKF